MFRLLVLLLVLCTTLCVNGCPRIITRAQWGSRYQCTMKLRTPVPWVIIHHTAGAFCNSKATCMATVKSIQLMHKKQGWCDIGYNFLIGNDGNVYEGQGWTKPSRVAPYVHNFIGISFMGNFKSRAPSAAALKAAQQLITCGVAKKYIRRDYVVKGHRDVTRSACPGNALYNIIKKWPRYKPYKG